MPRAVMIPLYPGDKVSRAGLEILEVLAQGHQARHRIYRARFWCCKSIGEISHDHLMRRIHRGSRTCAMCRLQTPPEQAPPALWAGPDWDVPQAALEDPALRFDSGRWT